MNGFNLVQFKQICQKHGVTQKGNKKTIVKRSEQHRGLYTAALENIRNQETKKHSQLHQIHSQNFNAEDIFNRELLDSLPTWVTQSWRHKLSCALIMAHLLNAFVIYVQEDENHHVSKDDFLVQAAGDFEVEEFVLGYHHLSW